MWGGFVVARHAHQNGAECACLEGGGAPPHFAKGMRGMQGRSYRLKSSISVEGALFKLQLQTGFKQVGAKLQCGIFGLLMCVKNILKDKKTLVLLGFVIYGVFVRIQELGYSNLQGDEINPLDYLYENNFIHYILNQKRGPLQYLINFANTSFFGYISEFQVRLPYLLFALGGLYTLYLLAKKIFDKQTALYTMALLSINGLFIAFSRIAQYQSFLFFALPLSGYLFVKHFEKQISRHSESQGLGTKNLLPHQRDPSPRPSVGFRMTQFIHRQKFILASALTYSLCLLAHYDALSMLLFFVLYTACYWMNNRRGVKGLLKDFIMFFVVALIPNLLFYGSMRLNPYYEEVTKTYLGNRLGFGGFMPRLPDIMPIISLYIPRHYLLVLLVLLTIGLIGLIGRITEIQLPLSVIPNLVRNRILKQVQNDKKKRIFLSKSFIGTGYISLCLLLAGAVVFGCYPIKPRMATLLVLGASMGITAILFLSKKAKPEIVGLVGWFLFPFCTYFFLIRDPRTHVYTALIPGFILAGYGIHWLTNKFSRYSELGSESHGKTPPRPILKQVQDDAPHTNLNFPFITITLFLIFESVVVWQMFVDKTPEYPWWTKRVFGRVIYNVSHSQHKKPEGVFGVPYYRGWERLAEGFGKGCLKGSFHSNEKNSVSYFYTRIEQVGNDEVDNLVLVEGPHSWKYIEESGYEPKKEGYILIKTIESSHALPVMYIWGRNELYPEGRPFCEF